MEGFWDALRILNGSNRVQSATAVCMVSVQRSKTAPSEVITGGRQDLSWTDAGTNGY